MIKTYLENWTNEWCAYYDDDEPDDDGGMDRGWGKTEEEAIQELKDLYPREGE